MSPTLMAKPKQPRVKIDCMVPGCGYVASAQTSKCVVDAFFDHEHTVHADKRPTVWVQEAEC